MNIFGLVIPRAVAVLLFLLTLPSAAFAANTAQPVKPPVQKRLPEATPKKDFNRGSVGGASGVNPGLRKRAYGVIDGLEKPGGAQSMGLRSHEFKNDGRNGSTVLPKTTPSGESISYRTTYLRPNTPGRSYANGRVTTGSDGSAYVSRHHGDKGGKVKRIQ